MEAILNTLETPSQRLSELLALGALELAWQGGAGGSGEDDGGGRVGVIRATPAYLAALERGLLDGLFAEIAETYRDVFGGDPWNEYLACPGSGCQGTVGSGAAFGLDEDERQPLWLLEATRSDRLAALRCPLCGARDLRPFYNKPTLTRRIRREFGQDVAAALLFDGRGAVVGLSYGWFTTLEKAWREKFALTFPTLAFEQAAAALEDMDVLRGPRPETPVFFYNEWAVLPAWRSGVTSMKVFQAVLECASRRREELGHADVDLLGTVMLGTNAHGVYAKLGILPLALPYAANVVMLHTTVERLHGRLKDRLSRLDALAARRAVRRSQAAAEVCHG